MHRRQQNDDRLELERDPEMVEDERHGPDDGVREARVDDGLREWPGTAVTRPGECGESQEASYDQPREGSDSGTDTAREKRK